MATQTGATTETDDSRALAEFTAKYRNHAITVYPQPDGSDVDHSIHTGGAILYGRAQVCTERPHPQFEVWANGRLVLTETLTSDQAATLRNAF